MIEIEIRNEERIKHQKLSASTPCPVLVRSGSLVILATRMSAYGLEAEFEGIVVATPNKTWKVGQFARDWTVQEFFIAPDSLVVEFRNKA